MKVQIPTINVDNIDKLAIAAEVAGADRPATREEVRGFIQAAVDEAMSEVRKDWLAKLSD